MAVVRYRHVFPDPAHRRTAGAADGGYAYADDAPLAQNFPHCDQIMYAFPALRAAIRRRFPSTFAASDMLVYPHKGDLSAAVAPDAFVAFGAREDLLGYEEEQAGRLAAEERAAAAEAEIARPMGLLQQRDLTSQPE